MQLSVIDNRLNRLNVIIHVTKELLKTKCPNTEKKSIITQKSLLGFYLDTS